MTEPLDWAKVPTASLADAALRKRLRTWERMNQRAGYRVEASVQGDELVMRAWGDGVQARSVDSFTDHPGLTEQIAAAFGYSNRPWRVASIRDAIGVPAIHRCVTIISKTVASLSMQVYGGGRLLKATDRPRVAIRPNPFTTAHDFFRDTAYSMATRGEVWWWIAARDSDGMALSVIPVPAHEVMVEEDPADPRYPAITWRTKSTKNGTLRREDLRQITLMREPGELRGFGPLQMCGAAVSVAVESQEWAANFFAAGGYPNIWIKAAGDLSGGRIGDPETDPEGEWESEIDLLKAQWMETAPNTPKVTDEGIVDIKQFDPNPQGAQMLEARLHGAQEAANMFGIPGTLLEYGRPGSSLSYQNIEQEKQKLIDTGIGPNYLEPIEQTFSDLLTRSYTARFNRYAFLQADIKTRYEVYELGVVKAGILDRDEARQMEGLEPGDVETAPVPLAPPAAIPASMPQPRTAADVRCDGLRTRRRAGATYVAKCDRLLSTNGSFTGTCPRCKKDYSEAA